jgi:hypothetical protein
MPRQIKVAGDMVLLMPKVVVKKTCSLTPDSLFSKVQGVLSNDSELKKLDPSYKCDFNPSQFTGLATGKMFSANLKVSAHSQGAEVEIVVDLPFALALAKGLVQKTLEKKLNEVIG